MRLCPWEVWRSGLELLTEILAQFMDLSHWAPQTLTDVAPFLFTYDLSWSVRRHGPIYSSLQRMMVVPGL